MSPQAEKWLIGLSASLVGALLFYFVGPVANSIRTCPVEARLLGREPHSAAMSRPCGD